MNLEFTIDGDIDEFEESGKTILLNAIIKLLEMGDISDLKYSIRRGSIKLALEVSPSQADTLLRAFKSGRFEEYSVVDARLEEGHESMEDQWDVTQLLLQWGDGDEQARGKIMVIVYEELKRIAHNQRWSERPGATMNTTALVHEAFFRLVDQKHVQWKNRAHFYAIAARLMRRILKDYFRKKKCPKAGRQRRERIR